MNKNSVISTATAVILIFLMASSAFLVLSNPAASTVKAQTVTSAQAESTIPSNMLQYEWPILAASLGHTFYSAGPAPSVPNIAWKATIPGVSAVNGAIVAFDGLVFVQTPSQTYALDGGTGNVVWNASVLGQIQKIDDTYMIIGTTCVYTANGTKVWSLPSNSFTKGGTYLGYVSDIKMILCTDTGWSLPDPSQPPTVAWNRTNTQYYSHERAKAYGDGREFIGTTDGYLICLNATTGTTLWMAPATEAFFGYGATYYDGEFIFGGLDDNMHCWNASTGQLMWTYNPGTWYGEWASGSGAAYGMIYEHNQDTYLYAINATTGQLVWRAKGPGVAYSGFLDIADGKVYSTMGEYQYRDPNTGEYGTPEYDCFNAYTGQLIWTMPLETSAGPYYWDCVAYGNMYIIPVSETPSIPGEFFYGGVGTLNEVWCISSQTQDWPMFLANPAHTAEGAGPTNLALKWKFQADGPIVDQPMLSNGVAYFGTTWGTIYAVDASSGTQKWNYSIGFPIKSSLAVVNGKVYTGADDGNVYCLDAATGTLVWKTFAGGVNIFWAKGIGDAKRANADVRASPMVLGSSVYVGALDGNLYCLDANSGNVVWKYQTGGAITAAPAITGGAIYVASNTPSPNGTLYKLDLNGNLMWKKNIPYDLTDTPGAGYWLPAAPTVADGMVFLRNGFRLNYGINATTGETIWTYNGKYNPGTPSQYGGVIQTNAMLYAYGVVYFNDYYGITCLNATTGAEIWYTYLSRENDAQGLAYAYGRIYTVNELGVLYVLGSLTGEKFSYYALTSQIHSTPSLYNGNLYVGCYDWNLYCFGEARTMPSSSVSAASASVSSLQAQAPSTITQETPATASSTPTIAYVTLMVTVAIIATAAASVLIFRKRK